MIFNKAVAIMEGYVDRQGDGYCSIKSEKFKLEGDIIQVGANSDSDSNLKFQTLKNVHFKAYYFIYNRPEYYDFDPIFTKLEYNSIKKMASESSGIKLYRNGFRVLPYGEKGNDWLDIDSRLSKVRHDAGVSIPFSNNNLFGFVEIIDEKNQEEIFNETASREGLIENHAFKELSIFSHKVLRIGMFRLASAKKFIEEKKKRDKRLEEQRRENNENKDYEELVEELETVREIPSDDPDKEERSQEFLDSLPEKLMIIKRQLEKNVQQKLDEKIEELAMLRVLASIGLVIGEFVHEIEQFDTIFSIEIKRILNFSKKNLPESIFFKSANKLAKKFNEYKFYSSYFRSSVSQNAKRELINIDIKETVNKFVKENRNSSIGADIEIVKNYKSRKIETCLMHPSEWNSILFNLYTNSKKALKRESPKDKKIKHETI